MSDPRITATMLIGAGGTGAILAPLLGRLLAFHPAARPLLDIVDADTYDTPHNQVRQPCGLNQHQQNKAEWVADLCIQQGLNHVKPIVAYATRSTALEFLLDHERPLIVTAVDNAATRTAVFSAVDRLADDRNFLIINPGNADASDGEEGQPGPILGQVMVWGRADGQDIGLDPRLLHDDLRNPADIAPTIGSCAAQQASAPQLLASNALAAAHSLVLLTNFLDGTIHPGYSIDFNGRSDRTHAILS